MLTAPVSHNRRAPRSPARPAANSASGYSLVELLLVVALVAAMASVAVPVAGAAVDEIRVALAARYLQGRIMNARMAAVKHSTPVALRFEPIAGDYRFGEYADGNGNGVRAADIAAGLDPEVTSPGQLREWFPSVRFGLRAGIPDLDGVRSTTDSDGLRVGVSRILTLSPEATSSSGTMYVRGRRGQYAVRVLGATARIRLLSFDSGTQRWISR